MTVKTKTIRGTFEECQEGIHGHDKLVSSLRKTYGESPSKDTFKEEFVQHLKYSLVILRREPAVERTLDFVAKFITSFAEEIESDEDGLGRTPGRENPSPKEENFMLFMFDFLLLSHNANERAVRFRVCQMINKLLTSLGNDAQIDDELYDRIYKCMLQRLKDKCPSVRVQAVTALARLQDPEDAECPVTTAYLYLMKQDPNYEVRRMVLSCIAPSRQTLGAILERTRDAKDVVRKLAYTVLSEKVSVKSLTFEQRVKLLKDGLQDRTDSVKSACRDKLLQAWLRTFQGNILEVLQALDVEDNTDVGEDAVKVILEKADLVTVVRDFDLLDENHVIPYEKLTSEAVLYWKCMCGHFASQGASGEELLDLVLPSVSDFTDYVQGYLSKIKPRGALNETELEEAFQQEFISVQLLKIAALVDLTDEVGRKKLGEMTQDMMVSSGIPASLVADLVAVWSKVNTGDDDRVVAMAEMIADIREPISMVETSLSDDEIRKRELKLAGVKMELNLARDELEDTVDRQEFEKAAELKQKIVDLEATKDNLLEESMNKTVTQEVRTEKSDAPTLYKCLTITSEVLKYITMKELNPTLRSLMDTLVLPCIKNEDPSVRKFAVLSLGLACYLNKEYALQNLLLFVQISQIDHDFIQITSLNVIFDLLLTYGFEALQISATKTSVGAEEPTMDGDDDDDDSDRSGALLNSLLAILTKHLDSERPPPVQEAPSHKEASQKRKHPEIRTAAAEGMAKLLLAGRITSPKLLSRLLLLWYNPTTEDDTRLRQALAVFFNMYAFTSRANQEAFQEAFLPTLETLFNAPLSSPLAKVNEGNVAQFMVHLMDGRNLKNDGPSPTIVQESTVHDSLSVKLCNQVLQDTSLPGTRTLCQALTMLHVTMTDTPLIQDLTTLTKSMIRDIDDKVAKNALKRFLKKLEENMKEGETGEEGEPGEDSVTENGDTEDKENEKPEDEQNVSIQSEKVEETTESTETAEPNFKTPAVPAASARSKRITSRKTPKTRESSKTPQTDEGEAEKTQTGRKTRNTRSQRADSEDITRDSAATPATTDGSVTSESGRSTRGRKIKAPSVVFSTDSDDEEDASIPTPTAADKSVTSTSSSKRPTRSCKKAKVPSVAFSSDSEGEEILPTKSKKKQGVLKVLNFSDSD